jgi:hypothetical protein
MQENKGNGNNPSIDEEVDYTKKTVKIKRGKNEVKKGNDKKSYMKVRGEGGSVAVTVGKRIPVDWTLVELQTVSETDDEVVIRFKKVA